jgi:hypothetical protein
MPTCHATCFQLFYKWEGFSSDAVEFNYLLILISAYFHFLIEYIQRYLVFAKEVYSKDAFLF